MVTAAVAACVPVLVAIVPASSSSDVRAVAGLRTCDGSSATLVGTPGNDDLTGTPGPDVIQAGRGSDRVRSLGGRDLVCGGPGKDTLDGGPGADRLFGGDDRRFDQGDGAYFVGDDLAGGPGDDLIVGGDGRGQDSLRFDRAPRQVHVDLGDGVARGHGDDRFRGIEVVWGSAYGDRMVGRFTDLLPHVRDDLAFWGQGGADVLRSDGELQGGPGPDRLRSAAGYVEAGAGPDRLRFVPWKVDPAEHRSVSFVAGPGDDVLHLEGTRSSGSDPGRGDDVVVGGRGSDGVSLSPGDDTVTTGPGADQVAGGYGNDEVWTGRGADEVSVWCGTTVVHAGADDDVVSFGLFFRRQCAEPGDDVLVGGRGRGRLDYASMRLHRTADGVVVDLDDGTATGAAGTDSLDSFRDVVGSGGRDRLTGNGAPNVLTGGSGRDEVDGAGGDDELGGDRGDDRLHGGDGADTADGGDGTDTCDAEVTTGCEA